MDGDCSWGNHARAAAVVAPNTTSNAGKSRLAVRHSECRGLIDCPGRSALRICEPRKKKPDNSRNTSTPPETEPPKTWKSTTSAIAKPRSPSRS